MEHVTYTHLRENLSSLMDKVVQDSSEILVTRKGHESVVMMSESDYNSINETLYLLSTPANRRRIYEAINDTDRNNFSEWKP